jgi:PAS domain S-box-containing protein
MDFRIVDRQGEEHWIGHACQRVTGVGGKNLGRRESNRDVTGQKNAERALADSESLFRTLAEASPDAVTVTDLEGRIVFTSQRTVSLHDYDAVDDIVGRPAFELFPPEELERAAENMMRTLREGTIRNVEYKLLKKDGRFFIGEMNASLIKDSDGNPKAFLATTRDITRRKEGEVKLQQLNVELEAFAHTASHDLRGPLSSIGMAATLLRDLFDRPLTVENVADIKELMGTVERNVNRSQSLVQGLLSDAEAGRDPSQTAEIDVAGVVVSAVQDAMQPIEQAGLEVRSDPYMGHIVANHTHIYQLFSNLISNAIKYNDREDPVLNIKYLGEGPDGEKRYLVSDNGPGFAPGMKDRIFQPFVSGRAGEPGMGLSIVRKVVETYGGTIVAYNDGGACFEFSLFDYKSG